MDIMPEYLIKTIIAGDIDRMEHWVSTKWLPKTSHSAFVCSSKDGTATHRPCGLDMLRAEMA